MDTLAYVVNKKIKPVLVEKFGIALSTLIILQNSKKHEVMVANIDNDGYKKLVGAILSDKRVKCVFDGKQIKSMKTEWLKEAKNLYK